MNYRDLSSPPYIKIPWPAPIPRRSGTATVGNGARILFFSFVPISIEATPLMILAIVDLGRNREEDRKSRPLTRILGCLFLFSFFFYQVEFLVS